MPQSLLEGNLRGRKGCRIEYHPAFSWDEGFDPSMRILFTHHDVPGLIGYIGTSGAIGFVPTALVPRYDELVSCNKSLLEPSTPFTDQCRQLLLAQGVPVSQFDGR